MNTQQAILKCQKKAWQEIKTIQQSSNMVGVSQLINQAVEKTFGMHNRGLLIVGMKKLGELPGDIEHLMRIRRSNFDNHMYIVRRYLLEFIPSRLKTSRIYKTYIQNI